MHRIILGIVIWILSSISVMPASQAANIDGFMGIPWGANAKQVKQAMLDNGFIVLKENKNGIKQDSHFYGGYYANYPAGSDIFLLYDQMVLAVATIPDDSTRLKNDYNAIFNDLKGLLSEKYGYPETQTQKFETVPWNNGNKKKGTTFIEWPMYNNETLVCKIRLEFITLDGSPLSIRIIYHNIELEKKLQDRSKHNI